MKEKAIVPVVIGLGIVGVILLVRRAKAAPPEIPAAEIPTIGEIMGARSIAELNAYYNLIGELYIIGKIGTTEYMELYEAYNERWYELAGVTK